MATNNYTYTQEDEQGYVTTSHGADVLQDTNEVRRILKDLGEALSHAGYNNGSYPKDETSYPYVRGAKSDADFEISVAGGGVIKFVSREAGGNKTLFFKYNATKDKILFSADGVNYFELVPADLSGVDNDHILKYDSANSKFISALLALSSLADTNIGTPGAGDWLKYDDATGKWINAKPTLNDLDDVSISSPADGQVLKYNGTTGKWENVTP